MADISNELRTIEKGRYGIDIRMAIHDALEKIGLFDQSPRVCDKDGYRMRDKDGKKVLGRS